MAKKSPGVFLPRRIFSFFTALAFFTLFSPSAVPAQDQPTVISNVKVEPSPFSPNGDGINETTTFSFTLSEPSRVTVEIMFFGSDVTIGGVNLFYGILTDTLRLGDQKILFASDTIYQNINAPAGLNEFIWSGTIKHNLTKRVINLPDSIYTYIVRAEDLDTDDQYKTRPVTGKVRIDSHPPVISSYSASPDPFQPLDVINNVARISFTLSGLPQNAYVGTIGFKVADVGAPAVRTLSIDQAITTRAFYSSADTMTVPFAPIPLQFIKRTKNVDSLSFQIRGGRILDSGDTVTVSTNVINIKPSDPAGTVYKDETRFSFIDNITSYNSSMDVVEAIQIEVRTSAGGVKVDVFDPANEKVAANLALDPPFTGDGVYAASFGPGNYADGTYTYVISAVDESGNLTEATGTVTARSNPIKVTDLTVVPAVISPADQNNRFDFCMVSYRLTQPGNVTIQVFRDSTVFVSNNLVRSLLTPIPAAQEAKGYTIKWDGKNDAGQFVSQNAERAYKIIVNATDIKTQQTSKASGLVTVDNRPPVEIVLDPLPARTNNATAVITGRAEAGDSVAVYLNGLVVLPPPAVDASFGLFSSSAILREGLNLINAQAFDAVGNGPTRSDTLRLVLDTRAPVVVDTLISVSGVSRKLAGAVLLGFGRTDTIALGLSDGVGRVSGVNLALSTISVSSPSGADIEGSLIQRPPNVLRFVPLSNNTQKGTYSLRAVVSDSLENKSSVIVTFNIGEASSGPNLVRITPAAGSFLNSRTTQNWQFTVQVADNSGTGINTQSSNLELYFLPSGEKIAGTFSAVNDLLTLRITQPIATDGSGDGEYELRITVEDNDPSSGVLSAAFRYLNDTRLPDTLHVAADSARFAVTLADPAPGSGIDIDPLASSITVTLGGVAVARARYSNDGDSTLFASFDPPLSDIGVYTMTVNIQDRAGNTRTRTVTFSIGGGLQIVKIVPANDSIVSRTLAEGRQIATITIKDLSGTGIDSSATSIKLIGPSGDSLPGRTEILPTGDVNFLDVNFLFRDLLPVDGSADGRYRIEFVGDDKSPLTAPLQATSTFLYDTRAPDTVSTMAYGGGRIDSVAVLVSDSLRSAGREVSGFDPRNALSFLRLLSPEGQQLNGVLTPTSRGQLYRLTLIFDPPLRGIGIYTLEVGMADFAGNSRERNSSFAVGSAELRPTVENVSQPFDGVAKNAAALVQPLIVGLQVKDNSGTGIDWASSFLRIFGPDSVEIQGQLSWQQQALILAIGKTLSNSGSDDGLYRLAAHVQDFSPLTGNLDTTFSFILDNLPPDTAGIIFAPDTSSISIRLADNPAVSGRASSGVNILTAQAGVSNPTGAQVAAVLSHDGVSTLSLGFTNGKPIPAGLYTLTVTFSDRAGNQRVRNIVFPLNVTGIVTLFPPDSSVVRGNLFRVWAMVTGMAETLAPGTAAVIRVNRRGVPVAGLSRTAGDTVIFAFSDTLRTDGSADGKYEVIAELDIQALGSMSTRRAFFTVDNVPPDTSRIELTISAQGVRVIAELTDHGLYPDVGGIDQKATTVKIEDPAGRVIEPDKVVWLDENTLEAQFSNLATAGLHRLRFDIQDRAGLVTTRRVALINTFGLARGTSVSFVEEVPARTKARINFVSGHTDKKITRAVLRIFNLRGDLIRRLDVTERIDASGSAVNAEWLLDNDGGSLVMNGVFIYGWEVTFSDGWTEKIKKTLAVARK